MSSGCGDLLVLVPLAAHVFSVRKDIDMCKRILHVHLSFKIKNHRVRYN